MRPQERLIGSSKIFIYRRGEEKVGEREGGGKKTVGQHALNNVLGGSIVEREALQAAAQRVVRRTNESEGEHIRPGGWYSHSALVDTLQHTANGQWKVLFNRLTPDQYAPLLQDPLALGAIVNENNAHWVALVKHDGLLWHVDSQHSPKVLDEAGFMQCLERFPDTFALARREHWGDL